MAGYNIHGESVTDGNASAGIAVSLYEAGSVTARTLGAKEVLHVTDVDIYCENGGDVFLVADGKVAGEYLVNANLDAKGGVVKHYANPFICAPGTTPVFYGATADRNVCLIQGFITEA